MIVPFALALLAAAPQDSPVRVGIWTITPATPSSCQASASFGAHVSISIEDDGTGNGRVMIADNRWRLKQGETRRGTFSWDGSAAPVAADFTAERLPDKSWVLIAQTGPWMTENLVAAKRFRLAIPALRFDESFDVPDAYAVTAAISECSDNL